MGCRWEIAGTPILRYRPTLQRSCSCYAIISPNFYRCRTRWAPCRTVKLGSCNNLWSSAKSFICQQYYRPRPRPTCRPKSYCGSPPELHTLSVPQPLAVIWFIFLYPQPVTVLVTTVSRWKSDYAGQQNKQKFGGILSTNFWIWKSRVQCSYVTRCDLTGQVTEVMHHCED